MTQDIERELARWRALQNGKSVWNNHWDDLAYVMLPRRLGFSSQQVDGASRMDTLFDGTPMQAARGLANAVGGMTRPEGRHFFTIRAEDDDIDNADEAQEWLDDSARRLRDAMENPKSRFRQATGEADLDLVVFGTSVLFAGENRRRDGLLYQSVHLKDATVFFGEEGTAEGMYRLRRFTLREAEQEFGRDALSAATRKRLEENKLDEKVDILHAVVPRTDGRKGALFARNLPYSDRWIEIQEKHEIRSGGFHEFPFVVPRWDTSSGEEYGRSPGMIALPDANTLQAMGETMLVAGQRSADPPLMAPNDGSFSEINAFPGGLTYYDVETAASLRGNPFFALNPGSNMPLTREMQMDMREQVFAAYYRNVLNLPVDGPQMTATEVMQRKEEFIREVGPVFGRLESDYTGPLVERSFNVMLRAGRFLPIPEVLQGRRVGFEYESPIKKMRQQIEAMAAAAWADQQFLRAQIRPEAADLVNVDALGRFEAEAAGLPNGIMNGNDEVQAMRQSRAEAQKTAEQMALVEQMAGAADKAAGAASKAGLVDAA